MRCLCIKKHQDYHGKVVSFLTLLHSFLPNRSCTSISKGEQEHWHHSSFTEQSNCHTAPLWEAPFLATENITEGLAMQILGLGRRWRTDAQGLYRRKACFLSQGGLQHPDLQYLTRLYASSVWWVKMQTGCSVDDCGLHVMHLQCVAIRITSSDKASCPDRWRNTVPECHLCWDAMRNSSVLGMPTAKAIGPLHPFVLGTAVPYGHLQE